MASICIFTQITALNYATCKTNRDLLSKQIILAVVSGKIQIESSGPAKTWGNFFSGHQVLVRPLSLSTYKQNVAALRDTVTSQRCCFALFFYTWPKAEASNLPLHLIHSSAQELIRSTGFVRRWIAI